jgi:hypothetical protein
VKCEKILFSRGAKIRKGYGQNQIPKNKFQILGDTWAAQKVFNLPQSLKITKSPQDYSIVI